MQVFLPGVVDRQRDADRDPLPQGGGNIHAPTQRGDDLIHHRQTDAGAPHRVFGFEKFLFDLFQVVGRNAAALVAHRRRDRIPPPGQREEDGSVRLGVFDGVVQDVDEHLVQPRRPAHTG